MRLLLFLILLSLPVLADPYTEAIDSWHQSRVEKLTRPDGWLSLAGLYWLKPGVNTVGSHPDNDLRLPEGPSRLGQVTLADGEAKVELQDEKHLVDLSEKEGTTVFRQGNLSWYFIRRNNQVGIRLKNRNSRVLKEFSGLDRYPVATAWRFQARLEPTQDQLAVDNVQGWTDQEPSPGRAVFRHHGREHSLKLIGKPDDKEFFIVFRDQTSGRETYGMGRFLYVARRADGSLDLDFNKSYNPPCAFTPYATCPMPPEENELPFAVTAGEKAYQGGH